MKIIRHHSYRKVTIWRFQISTLGKQQFPKQRRRKHRKQASSAAPRQDTFLVCRTPEVQPQHYKNKQNNKTKPSKNPFFFYIM